MLLSILPTPIFAVSRHDDWQLAAIKGEFLLIGDNRNRFEKTGFKPQINQSQDYCHNGGGSLEVIEAQLHIKRGRYR